MNFIQICFSFKGRINRATWWMMQLPTIPIFVITSLITYSAYTALSIPILITSVYLVPIVLLLVLVWVNLAVTAKRLHDRNKSAWWLLIYFIPIIAMFELGFIKGTRGNNRFGADAETSSETVIETLIRLCGVSAIIFVFGIFFFVFREGRGFPFRRFRLRTVPDQP